MIVCSISTIPGRIQGFLRVLGCIQNQTRRPDKIFITIAKFYSRMKKSYPEEEFTILRQFLATFPIETEIVEPEDDIGPSVKLTTPLTNGIINDDDVIIILDDDTLIFNETIELLVNAYHRFGEAVYGFIGVMDNAPEFFYHGEQVIGFDAANIDMLGGYRGVLYPVKRIRYDIQKWVDIFVKEHEKDGTLAMHDDHIFTYYLKHKNIERRIVKIPVNHPDECKYKHVHNTNGIFGSGDTSYKSLMKTVDVYEKIKNGTIQY
jgi:hypothetical protein